MPYAHTVVELDEGIRVVTIITGCPAENVTVGMRVHAVIDRPDDDEEAAPLILFTPTDAPPLTSNLYRTTTSPPPSPSSPPSAGPATSANCDSSSTPTTAATGAAPNSPAADCSRSPSHEGETTMSMNVGVTAGYWSSGPPAGVEQLLEEAEAAGVDSFWTAEAYGSDALDAARLVGGAHVADPAGHSHLPAVGTHADGAGHGRAHARSLSQGRLLLGVGASGPQVVEGWYGEPYPKPLERTREYVEIMRRCGPGRSW